MLSKLKTHALLILTGLVGVLVSLLSISGWRGRRARAENKTLKADNEHRQEVAEKDIEIEEQTRSRRTDALQEIKQGNIPTTFSDPNGMRNHKP